MLQTQKQVGRDSSCGHTLVWESVLLRCVFRRCPHLHSLIANTSPSASLWSSAPVSVNTHICYLHTWLNCHLGAVTRSCLLKYSAVFENIGVEDVSGVCYESISSSDMPIIDEVYCKDSTLVLFLLIVTDVKLGVMILKCIVQYLFVTCIVSQYDMITRPIIWH